MKFLCIGDLVGKEGLNFLKENLKNLQEIENINFTIVNAENVADGVGIRKNDFQILKNLNIDVITMGNHTFGKKDIFEFIDDKILIRPANYPMGVPGKGFTIIEKNAYKIAVVNLMGRAEINVLTENPFLKVDKILKNIDTNIVLVDFHAEATAEKEAMGYFLDGKVSCVFGTHSHVQTADEKILDNGTGYITDIGMTGPKKSVLGMDIDVALKRFLTSIPERYCCAKGNCQLNSIVVNIDDNTGKTLSIKRLNL